jgi:hypothetical protein
VVNNAPCKEKGVSERGIISISIGGWWCRRRMTRKEKEDGRTIYEL